MHLGIRDEQVLNCIISRGNLLIKKTQPSFGELMTFSALGFEIGFESPSKTARYSSFKFSKTVIT